MKKIISFIVVFTMILSCFAIVTNAAGAIRPTVVGNVVKSGDSFEGSTNSKTLYQSTPNAEFDFRAELKMENVQTAFQNALALYETRDPSEFILYGDFVISITYPKANFDATALETDVTGGTFDESDFYQLDTMYNVESASVDTVTSETETTVTINVNVVDSEGNEGINMGTLIGSHANPNSFGNIIFEAKDIATSAYGTYKVKVKITGETSIKKIVGGSLEDRPTGARTYESNLETITAIVNPPEITGGGGFVPKYTVTFETNGGTEISEADYRKGNVLGSVKNPEKEGYIFAGWYIDEECTQLYDVDAPITKDITLYAKWVEDNGVAGNGYATPDMLNGDDHFAYVVGYPDGTVRPNGNITRAEVTAIFFRLLKENIRTEVFTSENSFADVNAEDWYNNPVSTMAKLGIVKGRTEDGFAPNEFITRAEFAAICSRFDDSEFEATVEFTDVKGHWAEAEINEAAAHGWIRGYEDGTFKPDRNITRAEAMTMINRVLNRAPQTAEDLLEGMVEWPDNSDASVWYYLPVQEATNSHECNKKDIIYEKWTSLEGVTDWTKYEK